MLPEVAVGAGDAALALAAVSLLGVDVVVDAGEADAAGEAVALLAEADGSDGCAAEAVDEPPPAAFSNSVRLLRSSMSFARMAGSRAT